MFMKPYNKPMKMVFDEIHYDTDSDYGFFCNLDEYDNIKPSLYVEKENDVHKESIEHTIETEFFYKEHVISRYRVVLLNALFMIGTCVSTIFICYKCSSNVYY